MKKEKVIIWGCGSTGKKIYNQIKNDKDVLFFIDADPSKHNTQFEYIYIYSSDKLLDFIDYDKIIIGSIPGLKEIPNILKQMNIAESKIDTSFLDINAVTSRIIFLEKFSELVKNKCGCVAEAGVFTGEFAKEINKNFPNNKCFLFDTFSGFDAKDIALENIKTDSMKVGYYSVSSVDIVIDKLPYKENVKIFKGYFPETVTEEVRNSQYIFVNLDMDLYNPTLEGLNLFYSRLIDGGVILIHDYFSDAFPNVKKAVEDYEKQQNIVLRKIPIGDGISLAIIK